MNKLVSLALLIGGIILLVLGARASDSIGSDFSRLFTGAPTDKAIWLVVGGAVMSVVGLIGTVRGSRSV